MVYAYTISTKQTVPLTTETWNTIYRVYSYNTNASRVTCELNCSSCQLLRCFLFPDSSLHLAFRSPSFALRITHLIMALPMRYWYKCEYRTTYLVLMGNGSCNTTTKAKN